MKTHTAETKRFSPFAIFFMVFLVLNLIAIFCGLSYVRRNLASYEASMPVYAAEAAAAIFEVRDYDQIAEKCGFIPTDFCSEQSFRDYLDSRLQSAEHIEYKKQRSSADETTYLLKANDEPLARAILRREEKPDAFGRSRWKIAAFQDVYEFTAPYTISAPEFVTVSVNGIPLGEKNLRDSTELLGSYDGLPDSFARPKQRTYQVEGLLSEPTLSAAADNGCTCTLVPDQNDPHHLTATVQPNAQDAEAASAAATQVAQKYARFITQDASFRDVAAHLIPGTEYYNKIKTFYNGWYIDHNSYSFENMKIESLAQYDTDHISCKLSFLYVIQKGQKRFEFPSIYDVYLVRTDKGWKVADLLVG